jgi:tRNA pseudouridine38-40 synthase
VAGITRFKFTIEYDGRPFMGWQHQDHGPSVQSTIEAALHAVTQETVQLIAAGRTDSGVHAKGQVAHADIEKEITPYRLMQALNYYLCKPGMGVGAIAILACDTVPADFHARFNAIKRAYEYRIINRRFPLTFDRGLAWQVIPGLDHEKMHAAAQLLLGNHDFTTFRSVKCQSHSPVKTLDKLDVSRWGNEIIIVAEARSFLHHQVRSMVGCLKFVGEGRWTARDLQKALEAKNRAALGFNAPPDGLYFMRVDY